MSLYTTPFLKIFVRTLQQGTEIIEISVLKNVVDDMVKSEKLIVAANTLPIYFITQMYIPGDKVKVIRFIFS